jgi:membrane protein YqaA with SNARE-associated domain
MNEAHIHLLTNHMPILITLVGAIVLLIGQIMKQHKVIIVGLAIILGGALSTLPAYFSGEGAEEIVESMSIDSKTHELIHEHEEMAESALITGILLILSSILGVVLAVCKMQHAPAVALIVLILAFVHFFLVARAGSSGGKIRHPEVREGFIPQYEDEHDDD